MKTENKHTKTSTLVGKHNREAVHSCPSKNNSSEISES